MMPFSSSSHTSVFCCLYGSLVWPGSGTRAGRGSKGSLVLCVWSLLSRAVGWSDCLCMSARLLVFLGVVRSCLLAWFASIDRFCFVCLLGLLVCIAIFLIAWFARIHRSCLDCLFARFASLDLLVCLVCWFDSVHRYAVEGRRLG